MKYIIVDTETTGLFVHRNPDGTVRESDALGQPRMCEFAGVLVDENFNVEQSYQQYCRPNGWLDTDGNPLLEMPPEAFSIHGLSMEFLHQNGVETTPALNFYSDAVKDGRVVIGFNNQHDGRQIRAELRHAGLDDMFEKTPVICAMRSITTNMKGQVKKLNGKGGFPRLIDAAAHFGIPYPEDKRHTALEDALVTAQVARFLHGRGALLAPDIYYAKNHPSREG